TQLLETPLGFIVFLRSSLLSRPQFVVLCFHLANMATQMSKKRKFVADGVFFAELNEVLTRELAEDGYSGVEVRVTPMRTEIIIRATRTQNVLGEKGRRIRELTSVVQKRFKFPENSVELYAEKVNNRGLCAIAQAESLRYKLLGGLAVRRACYGVLRFVMESGAKGCEVIVSGKLRAQRAKAMKFKDGYMISSGQPCKDYIDSAVRHILMRQGVLGIKVKIMLDWDPKGKQGPTTPLPDVVIIHPPKEEETYIPPAVAVPPPTTEIEILQYNNLQIPQPLLTGSKYETPTIAPMIAVSTTPPETMLRRKFLSDGDPDAASATCGITIDAVTAADVAATIAFSFKDAFTWSLLNFRPPTVPTADVFWSGLKMEVACLFRPATGTAITAIETEAIESTILFLCYSSFEIVDWNLKKEIIIYISMSH
ncbi:hypothetical protein V2J09_001772, partial [Rumex salicifolius]